MSEISHNPPLPEPPAGHPSFLAHHFQTPAQQYSAGKLGMWIFLLTEVLLFGGLICAYAVYRSSHPQVFQYAHHFLNKNLGALNTCVLLLSSLTMAWALHCAQRNQKRGLVVCLAVTLACAGIFLGVKYVEYKQKWEHGLLWARSYKPPAETPPAAEKAAGRALPDLADAEVRKSAGTFFSIYFAMTGLHALHVIVGMGAIAWVLFRAVRGQFGSHYFAPVDYVGLYWHLVDMIWIYLFPLLYLIH
jgi:cytochrome c oxidase subunit 3